jgi:phosphatidylglycerophosphate synthase
LRDTAQSLFAFLFMSTITGERRPIAARHWNISKMAAQRLAQFGISPNAISVSGLLFALAAGAAFATTPFAGRWTPVLWIVGAVGIGLRLLCNMLDGMVAVEGGKVTKLGELFNEIPDRFADAAILIGLGYSVGGHFVLGFIAAIAAVLTAYIRAVGKVAGARQEFCGPMAKQQRMAVAIVVALVSSIVATNWLPAAGLAVIIGGSLITAIRRLLRIAVQLRMEAS